MRRLWPFRHFGLKLMSVGLAVLLWLTVSGEETVERGLRVPLELQQFPAGLEIQGEAPSTVDVRVRGTSGALSRVAAGDVVAVLDLQAARTGNRLFPLTPELVHAPFGVEVVQVIAVHRRAVVRAVGDARSAGGRRRSKAIPAPGYVLGKVTVTPDRVEIVGPGERRQARARGADRDDFGRRPSGLADRRDVTIGLIDPALRLKTQRTVSVQVQILPGPVERTVRNRPVHLRNLGAHLSAQAMPVVVDVGLRGSRESLSRLDADAVTAYVDVAGLGAGDYDARRARRRLGSGRRDPYRSGNDQGANHQCQKLNEPPATAIVRHRRRARRRRAISPRSADRPTARRRAGPRAAARHGDSAAGAAPGCSSAATRASRARGSKPSWRTARPAREPSVTSAGVVPTPAIAYLTRSLGYDAGIVISASHNPFEDNGIKVFSGRGEKFTESVEREVEAIVADASWNAAGGQARAVAPGQTRSTRISIICAPCSRRRRRSRDFKLAIDCANGATTRRGARALREPRLRHRRHRERARRPQHQPRLRVDASRGARADRRRARLPTWAWRSTATATARSSWTTAARSSTATPSC